MDFRSNLYLSSVTLLDLPCCSFPGPWVPPQLQDGVQAGQPGPPAHQHSILTGYDWAEEVNQELERHRQPCLPGVEVSSQLLGPCGLQLCQ